MSYRRNLTLWWLGWRFFEALTFKAGWSADSPKWWLMYALNHGTRTLTGGAVMPWSRWFYETRNRYWLSAMAVRVVDAVLGANHCRDAGPALWGTQDTDYAGPMAYVWWLLIVPGALSALVSWVV